MDYEIEGQIRNTDEDVCCRIQCDVCIASFLVTLTLFFLGYIIIITLNN